MDMSVIEDRKARARGWFEQLRNDICAAFEKLEDERRRRSIRATRGVLRVRAGTAPTIPASPAAAG